MFARTKQGAVHVVQGAEPIHADTVSSVNKIFAECLDQGQPRIVLDLCQVPLVDSQALELLLDIQDECQQRGGALKLAAVNPLCLEILEVTGVGNHFEIHPDASAAVGSFLG